MTRISQVLLLAALLSFSVAVITTDGTTARQVSIAICAVTLIPGAILWVVQKTRKSPRNQPLTGQPGGSR